MAKSDYIPTNDGAFLNQLKAFRTTLPSYASSLGITAAQLADLNADTDYFEYILLSNDVIRNSASQMTSWKSTLRSDATAVAGAPSAPVLPPVVAAVAPGIEQRFRNLAQTIKLRPGYDESIGKALGIEGTQSDSADPEAAQPALKPTISGTEVRIGWTWEGFRKVVDICEIHVDRNDGTGEELLTYDTTPGYVDTHPFPATPQRWTYRAIFRANDRRVGKWSLPVTITVGG